MAIQELSRVDKAILSRRFEPHFLKQKTNAEDFFRGALSSYQRANWIKLTFDGETKRVLYSVKDLSSLLELAKKRFGVLKYLLATE